MKKSLLIILALLLIIPGVLAVSSDLKENYQPKETIIAEISGNILENIPRDNVELLRGHVLVAFEYDIKKLGGKYFLWGISPELENNYTLRIKDITTTVSGATAKIDYEKNFSVSGNLTDYYVKPGLVITGNDFELLVLLNEDNDKTIDAELPSREIILNPGENKIKFFVSESNQTGFRRISVGKYSIPIYIISEETSANVSVNETRPLFEIIPKKIERFVLSGEKKTFIIEAINRGSNKIDAEIKYNSTLFSISRGSFSIEPNSSEFFNLTMKSAESDISSSIYIEYDSSSEELPVKILITQNESQIISQNISGVSDYSCSERGGKICPANEVCSGNTAVARGELCCLARCIAKEEKSRAWIGYLIAGALILILIYFYMRYKKAKPSSTSLEKEISGLGMKH